MKYTEQEIADYVTGWLLADQDEFTKQDAHDAYHNALHQIHCVHDGLQATITRQRNYKSRETLRHD
jgi:hypothetical protein